VCGEHTWNKQQGRELQTLAILDLLTRSPEDWIKPAGE
jgi:hypothetical protein